MPSKVPMTPDEVKDLVDCEAAVAKALAPMRAWAEEHFPGLDLSNDDVVNLCLDELEGTDG